MFYSYIVGNWLVSIFFLYKMSPLIEYLYNFYVIIIPVLFLKIVLKLLTSRCFISHSPSYIICSFTFQKCVFRVLYHWHCSDMDINCHGHIFIFTVWYWHNSSLPFLEIFWIIDISVTDIFMLTLFFTDIFMLTLFFIDIDIRWDEKAFFWPHVLIQKRVYEMYSQCDLFLQWCVSFSGNCDVICVLPNTQ